MIIKLNTQFSDNEKKVLYECIDVSIKLCIQSEKLFYTGLNDENKIINNPHRMIEIGGYYLLEIKDEINEWHLGVMQKDFTYVFFGNYGSLEDAIRNL